MTRVIVVASGKGGVGKTTVAANLGIGLSLLDEDVLVLDMDINMANLELILGLEGKPVTLQEVLSGNENIYNAIYEGPGGVKIVPAGLSLTNLKYIRRDRMEDVFENLIGDLDILIIDSPAGLERDALAAMSPADEMILVTTPEITALSDTLKTKLVAQKLGIEILGVVLNRDQAKEGFLYPEEVEAILEEPIISIIPENRDLTSFASGKSVVIEEPESEPSQSFMQLASFLVGGDYVAPKVDDKSLISRFVDSLLGSNPFRVKKQKAK